jgi:acyl-CoA thioester hydrolase
MDLTALPITHRATIPEAYLDSMGHMNVMWYTHLFSCATEELFQLFGFDEAYFQGNQAGSFALSQFFRYLAEIRVGERVTIRSRFLGRSVKKLHFMHFMVKDEGGVLAATCEILAAHVDMKTRRTSPFPVFLADKMDRLVAKHAGLAWEPPICGAMKA